MNVEGNLGVPINIYKKSKKYSVEHSEILKKREKNEAWKIPPNKKKNKTKQNEKN